MRAVEGKHILVTGATSGMGQPTVIELAKEGSPFIGIHYSTNEERAKKLLEEVIGYGSDGIILKADMSKRDEVFRVVKQYADAGDGKIDGAAILHGYPISKELWLKKFSDITEEEFRKVWEVDHMGSVYTSQAVIPYMIKQKSGKLILIGSTPALSGYKYGHVFVGPKSANLALARDLAQELGEYNISVNSIAPGSTKTAVNLATMSSEEKEILENETALKRMVLPEEIARKVIFLASSDSDGMTGQTLVVDAGVVMR